MKIFVFKQNSSEDEEAVFEVTLVSSSTSILKSTEKVQPEQSISVTSAMTAIEKAKPYCLTENEDH